MRRFIPAFEITQVGSMQWNRTTPGAIVEATHFERPINISQEEFENIRNLIKEEINKKK